MVLSAVVFFACLCFSVFVCLHVCFCVVVFWCFCVLGFLFVVKNPKAPLSPKISKLSPSH